MSKMPSFLDELKIAVSQENHKQRLDNYFKNMEPLKEAISKGNIKKAKVYAYKSWAYLEDLILWDTLLTVTNSDEIRNIVFEMNFVDQDYDNLAMKVIRDKYPQLDANTPVPGKSELKIQSIPCIDEFGKLCALMGEHSEIDKISQIIDYYNDLSHLQSTGETLKKYLLITKEILSIIEKQPGVLQADLKKHIRNPDGRMISNICYYLEKYKKIKRNKTGKIYSLTIYNN